MEAKIKAFEKFLNQQGFVKKTVKECVRYTSAFLTEHPLGSKYNHKEVVGYLNEKKKDYVGTDTVLGILFALKKYFNFLVEIGEREDHPCLTLYMKRQRSRDIIHQDLFTSAELEQLLNRKEYFDIYVLKHQLTISFLIFQALTSGEILRLKVQDIDFDNGLMFIRGSKQQNSRHLEIHPQQFHKLDRYIKEVRKELLATDTNLLMISSRTGLPITIDDISTLTQSCKPMFPDRNMTPITIRQSVISNWLNEKRLPLEQVQIMAGHKWISSTERYRHSNLTEQRELMNKWFPLG
jgi:integrase/recombinase XerD